MKQISSGRTKNPHNKNWNSSSSQFQQFTDHHFLEQRKYQSLFCVSKEKSINSLSVYHNESIVNPIDVQYLHNDCIQFIKPKTEKALHRPKLRTQSTLVHKNSNKQSDIKMQRYNRKQSQNSRHLQTQPAGQQPKTNQQKINLLKRVIEHYNNKSTERNYYSNLMNNLGVRINTNVSTKQKIITIKKIVPKTSLRREATNNKNQAIYKIRKNFNINGYDIYDEYFNHSNMTVEAHSINDISHCITQLKDDYKHNDSNNKYTKSKIVNKSSKHSGLANYLVPKKGGLRHKDISDMKSKILQKMSDNCIDAKVNKFRQFLFMVNLANNVFRELDIMRYKNNFKVFIGKGNNSNLIKAIIKKRFWLQIVKHKHEANFVWTQIKEEDVYQQQTSIYNKNNVNCKRNKISLKSQTEQDELINQKMLDSKTTNQTSQNSMILATSLASSLANAQKGDKIDLKIQGKEASKTKTKQHMLQPQSKIFTNQQASTYSQIINQLAYKKRSKFSDRIRFLKDFTIMEQAQLSEQLVHNHFPLNGLLGNKKAMFYMLKQYYLLHSRNVFDVLPLTFHIKRGFIDDEYKHFLSKFANNRKNKLPNYWIIKPGQFSNRGQGISCTNKIDDIRSRIKEKDKNKSLILQQYIVNPLLYNGRKFDIRTYMLITVNNGKLRGYWYQDGYIRTSSYSWTLDEISDIQIHLTNDAIQKYSADYGKYEPGNKLTYSQLQRYLDSQLKAQIYPKMKQIATDAIKSSFLFIDPHRKANNFQIFGLDFMINGDFKPWLIEINTNPCLQINCPVLARIIPSMVQNAFRIAIDPIFPPPSNFSSTTKYSIPENALHYNKFQLIFDEDRDGFPLVQIYTNNKIVQKIDDYEQDKQIYEQDGPQINLQEPQV